MGTDDGTMDTAAAVAANLAAIRHRRGLTVRQLSQRLSELGAPILPSGITKIEQGQRRVDVNDLMALAAALNVSPARLLLPDVGERDLIQITPGMPPQELWLAWEWMEGGSSLSRDGEHLDKRTVLEYGDERPAWKRIREQHPVLRAYRALGFWLHALVSRVDEEPQRPDLWKMSVEAVRGELHGLSQALDRIEFEANDRG